MIALVATLLVTVLVAALVRGAMDDRADALPEQVRITEVPASYRVDYDVVTAAGPERDDTHTSETVQVERPFRSIVATRAGGDLVTGRVADLHHLYQHVDDRWTELLVPPSMAASDLRLDVVLDERVADGSVERTNEVRRIAGRACQVHRLGGPLDGGTIVPVGSVEDEEAEVCVDEAGLVLFEEWRHGGELLRRRTATHVEIDPELPADTFAVDAAERVEATEGGGFVEEIAADARFGDRTWELPRPPDGFERLGRWSVVWPRLETTVDPLAPPTEGRIAGIATVWASDVDALVVEQGGVSEGDRAFQPHPDGEEVDLGALDVGEVVTDGRGTEVRVAYTDGTFVRVWSTLPRDEVVAIARSLVAR